jgi:hypothetical protein
MVMASALKRIPFGRQHQDCRLSDGLKFAKAMGAG